MLVTSRGRKTRNPVAAASPMPSAIETEISRPDMWRRIPLMSTEQEAYYELAYYPLALRDPSFIHQHLVDAFTAQYASEQTKPIALTFSLVGLYLLVERQFTGRQVQ